MQKSKRLLIIALSLLLLLYSSSLALGQTYDNNTTNINSSLTGNVTGNKEIPIANSSDNVYNNKVIIDGVGTVVSGSVYGGYTKGDGDANGNAVSVNNGTVSGSSSDGIYGGYTVGGNAIGNSVDIGGIVNIDIYGGRTDATGYVEGNTVTLANGSITNAYVYGGWTNKGQYVTGNTVEIDGTAKQEVFGAYSFGDSTVSDNKVFVNLDGEATRVWGGYSYGNGNVIGNIVSVSGTVSGGASGAVYGGFAIGSGIVSDNRVEISGTASVNVYGGVGCYCQSKIPVLWQIKFPSF